MIGNETRVREILRKIKPLAVEYYQLTGKPLGVTGEVAECAAAELLDLTLTPARTIGHDALRNAERIQIRGRARGKKSKGQRVPPVKATAPCDAVVLVLLDIATLDALEIWEAKFADVVKRQKRIGGKGLHVSDFKRIARRVWATA